MKLIIKRHQGTINILVQILLSYLTFIILIVLLNRNNNDRVSSFMLVNLAAFISLAILSFGLKNQFGFNVMRILLIGFFIKILIGYFFWEFYFFPDYFSDPTSKFKFAHQEYLLTDQWMRLIANYRIHHGFFSYSKELIFAKHFPLHYFMSNLYLSGSFNPFDLSVQNCMFSIYTALIIVTISKQLDVTPQQMKYVLIIALYQPFSMITSTIWRDIVGQFFVALGGYVTLMTLNKKSIWIILMLIIASLCMLLQRDIYFFFPILAYTGYIIFKSKNRYNLLILPIIIGVIIYVDNHLLLSDTLESDYGGSLDSVKLWLYLPLNILRVFIGPFPWTQWLAFSDNTVLQISDYFQSVISISLVLITFNNLLNRKLLNSQYSSHFLLLLFLFIPFVFAGLGTIDIHQAYMTTGIIFLVPIVFKSSSGYIFVRLSYFIFSLFILLNIMFVLFGLSGLGIGSSTR